MESSLHLLIRSRSGDAGFGSGSDSTSELATIAPPTGKERQTVTSQSRNMFSMGGGDEELTPKAPSRPPTSLLKQPSNPSALSRQTAGVGARDTVSPYQISKGGFLSDRSLSVLCKQ